MPTCEDIITFILMLSKISESRKTFSVCPVMLLLGISSQQKVEQTQAEAGYLHA